MLIYQATLPICDPKKAKFDEKIVRWTLNPTFVPFYMKKKTCYWIYATTQRWEWDMLLLYQGIHPFTQPIFKIKNNWKYPKRGQKCHAEVQTCSIIAWKLASYVI